ncbi:hypothetical protein [Caballeronia glathei]|uniref:hypothetical protein n=1 Tax=Caballeronia glathei TaxID=60547 RepID=UPI00398A6B47
MGYVNALEVRQPSASVALGGLLTEAFVLSALRIDLRFQGLGVGTAALRHLPARLLTHWVDTTSIMLSVDEEHMAGRRSYAKAGWVDM